MDSGVLMANTRPRAMSVPVFVRLALAMEVGMLTVRTAAVPTGFVDYGVAAPVAECRGVVGMQDANGRDLVIAMALDESPGGYILVTDLEAGQTLQYSYPEGAGNSPVYASLASTNGRFYTAAGNVLLEFDPSARRWLFHGVAQREAACFVGSALADGPDGLVYGGTCSNSHLVSYNPQTHELKDYGRLDEAEQYFTYLAFDRAGWAYAGIGTARWNIVAFHPRTGERRQILAEAERQVGTARVYSGTDGKVYGQAGSQYYRLFEGRGEKIGADQTAPSAPGGAIDWGQRVATFPDGMKVTEYNLPERWLEVAEPKTGERRRVGFEFKAGGVMVTSLAVGPGDDVYASSAHPMHLIRISTQTQTMVDLGPIPKVNGGNFCAMARQGRLLIGAEYPHGALWAYDPALPWQPGGTAPQAAAGGPGRESLPTAAETGNPRELATWHGDLCRPRTALAHPDGQHVMMAGFAGYGRCGGGLGIVNLQTVQSNLLTAEKNLLPGHSIITLKVLPTGDLVGGTSIEAPGGGHPTATEAELVVVTWGTRKAAHHFVPVPGDPNIVSIEVGADGLVYGVSSNATFFVADAMKGEIRHRLSLASYGSVPRHALQWGPDGQLYALLSSAILRLAPGTLAVEKLADAPVSISAGGALTGNRLYLASGAHLWSYALSAP